MSRWQNVALGNVSEAVKRRNPELYPKPMESKPEPQKMNPEGSTLEIKFLAMWKRVGGPELVREYRFSEQRKWRSDFAHLESLTLIEIEGGVFNGRHTKGKGFMADCEKYLAAFLLGWRVVRLSPNLITPDNLKAVAVRIHLSSRA
jgi:hypothetical protein